VGDRQRATSHREAGKRREEVHKERAKEHGGRGGGPSPSGPVDSPYLACKEGMTDWGNQKGGSIDHREGGP